jgi:hypothetical protein
VVAGVGDGSELPVVMEDGDAVALDLDRQPSAFAELGLVTYPVPGGPVLS